MEKVSLKVFQVGFCLDIHYYLQLFTVNSVFSLYVRKYGFEKKKENEQI